MVSITSLCLAFFSGCGNDAEAKPICDSCGEYKETAKCSKKDAAKCATCEKNKGLPGCCVK